MITGSCTSSTPTEDIKIDLQGSWSGSYIEEREIKIQQEATANEDLATALTKNKIKETVDSIRFDFQGEQLNVYKGVERFYSLNLLTSDNENKELSFINVSEPKYLKSFVIEKISPDSLIIKEKNNIIYFKDGLTTSEPDTVVLAQYYNLKKIK